MSVAAQMEEHLRQRCRDRLPLVGAQMVADTQQACSRRSGDLAASVQCDEWAEEGNRYTTIISAGRGLDPDYAGYQDDGTGIYGPLGVPIVPLGNKPLAFVWPAAGTPVTQKNPNGLSFFWKVNGSPGTHFFKDPMPQRFHDALLNAW